MLTLQIVRSTKQRSKANKWLHSLRSAFFSQIQLKNYTLRSLSELVHSVYFRSFRRILKIISPTGWIHISSESNKRSFTALNYESTTPAVAFYWSEFQSINLLTWRNVISTGVTLALRWLSGNRYLLFLLGFKHTVFDFMIYYLFLNLPLHLASHRSSSV